MSTLFRLFLLALLAAIGILALAVALARHNAELLAPFHILIFFVLVAIYIAPPWSLYIEVAAQPAGLFP